MAEEDGTYYVFSTGDPAGAIGNGNIQIRTSRDLREWSYTGTVFAVKPAWITSMLGKHSQPLGARYLLLQWSMAPLLRRVELRFRLVGQLQRDRPVAGHRR